MISFAAATFRPTMTIWALPFHQRAKASASPRLMPEVRPTNTATGVPLRLATLSLPGSKQRKQWGEVITTAVAASFGSLLARMNGIVTSEVCFRACYTNRQSTGRLDS